MVQFGFTMKKVGVLAGFIILFLVTGESKCNTGCDLALASYYITQGDALADISDHFHVTSSDIMDYNPIIKNKTDIPTDTRINIPFSCDCIDGDFLAHVFSYKIKDGDTYFDIGRETYANLITTSWLQKFNSYEATELPIGGVINVTINCSCGDRGVSSDYGLFITYPLLSDDSLSFVAEEMNLSVSLLERYNPDADSGGGTRLVYIPGKDKNGSYRPLVSPPSPDGGPTPPGGQNPPSSPPPPASGISPGGIVGICAAVGLIALLGCWMSWYFGCFGRKTTKDESILKHPENQLTKPSEPGQPGSGGMSIIDGITIDKLIEFSHEELSHVTDGFSQVHKIGQGGFATVSYGELKGEKTAIKKMEMIATKEFLAELKVLSHVHHVNLVRLVGFCVKQSLCLVYEYIENGTLSQQLRDSGRPTLWWSTRLQIALDSARGLEYIHEHTVPVYIHRDIKSANILIDNSFRAKVADFGLTKLVEVGNAPFSTNLKGTFGYMPPEYIHFGNISPKVDVYAFGVVLFELISGKAAVMRKHGSNPDSLTLVSLFKDVYIDSDPTSICQLVDPRLGDDYPLDSVLKTVELARACTVYSPELRPMMTSVVVALLSLTTEPSDCSGVFYGNDLQNLVSGR